MGAILNEILNSIPKSEFDEKIKIICDKIMLEEIPKDKDYLPKGPNVLLAVQFDIYNPKFACFLCLEREMKEKYIVSLWKKDKHILNPSSLKRHQTWEVSENTPEKIFICYATKLKYLKGEN